jgi:hypothetical protein
MGTASDSSMKDEDFGIIPRTIRSIFSTIKQREQTHVHVVKVSFLEIHNEDLNDLLYNLDSSKNAAPKPIPTIRDGPNNSVIVANTEEVEVHSYTEMMDLLMRGSQNRVTAATQMNAHSSRSHAIFTIILSQKRISRADSSSSSAEEADTMGDEVMSSRFNFVDLAGSERLKRTGAVGDRMKEGININQGLLALGNVISALSDEKRRAGHVPYRDSKITRMLQDSLGGNSRTIMIACVSPADVNAEESLNTLKYANRTKNIKNKALQNKDPNSAKFDALKQRILQLEQALAAFTGGNTAAGAALLAGASSPNNSNNNLGDSSTSNNSSSSVEREQLSALRDEKALLQAEIDRLSAKIRDKSAEISSANDRLIAAESQRDIFRFKLEKVSPAAVAAIEANLEQKSTDSSNPQHVLGGVEEQDISLIEENRKTINQLHRKLNKHKKDLQTAMSLLESYTNPADQIPGLPVKNIKIVKKPIKNDAGEQIGEEVEFIREDKKANEASSNMASAENNDNIGDNGTEENPAEQNSEDELHSSDYELSESEEEEGESSESLKLLADLKEREFQHQMKQLTSEQHNLTSDIQSKLRSMESLRAQSQQILAVRKEYESKIETMEREMAELSAEREAALAAIESRSKEKDYQQQVAAIRGKYEEKLKTLTDQLSKTKAQLRENDKMKKQIKEDDSKIKKLEVEIAQNKKQKVLLSKQMELNTQKYKEFVESKEAKLRAMQKEAHKASLAIKRMQSDYDKQSAVLKRRTEEKSALEKQIKSQLDKKENAKKIKSGAAFVKEGEETGNQEDISPNNTDLPKKNENSSSSRRAARELRKRHSPLKSRLVVSKSGVSAGVSGNLSDSGLPQHSTQSDLASERSLQKNIDDYITAAVSRGILQRELDSLLQKREQLLAEQGATTEQMMVENVLPSKYTQLENSLIALDHLLQGIQRQIDVKQREIEKLALPSTSESSAHTNKPREASVDYRALLSLKIPSLDASKKALIYLMQQAVQQQQEKIEFQNEVEFLRAEAADEKRRRIEAERKKDEAESARKLQLKLSQYRVSSLQVHHDSIWENTGPSTARRTPSTQFSALETAEISSAAATPRDPRENNYLGSDNSLETEEQRKKSVFSRLTDAKQYTGMYRNIHENDKPMKQKAILASKPENVAKPGPQQKSLGQSSLMSSNSTDNLSYTAYNPLAGASQSLAQMALQHQTIAAEKNVFNRLTNPALFTGQHKFKKTFPANIPTNTINSVTQSARQSQQSNNNSPTRSRGHSRRSSETLLCLSSAGPQEQNQLSNPEDEEYAAAEAAYRAAKLHAAGALYNNNNYSSTNSVPTPRSRTTSASFSEGHTTTRNALSSTQPILPSISTTMEEGQHLNNGSENRAPHYVAEPYNINPSAAEHNPLSPDQFSQLESGHRFSFNPSEYDTDNEEEHKQQQQQQQQQEQQQQEQQQHEQHLQDHNAIAEEDEEVPSFHHETSPDINNYPTTTIETPVELSSIPATAADLNIIIDNINDASSTKPPLPKSNSSAKLAQESKELPKKASIPPFEPIRKNSRSANNRKEVPKQYTRIN